MTSFANGIRFYVNPKAKYLSNAVENVLYNIGKSDRSSLAWQTCRTNQRSLNNRRLSAQHDMVPLTRRVSSILKVPGWKRDEVDKAERRKNIFYQMLKASQDIADDNKISPILRPNCVTRQNGGMVAQNMKVKDDRIFNEIYDKLKGWLNKPTNVAENSFLLLNSSSIYKQPIAKDQDENIFRPYPEVPVYKVHHKKKIITKSKPRGTRKVKKPSVALSRKSKKRKSLKFRATVQFGKTVTGRRSHTGSQTESIVGLQQSRSAISRVFDSTVLIPKLDNNSKVPAVRNGIEPRANQISPKTLAYEVNERLASEETVYSIPLASQRKMEESTDVSKFNILRSPRTSSESELSKGSQKSHSSFHHSVRTFGSRKVLPIEEERTSQQSINSVLLAKSQQFMSSKKNAATSGHKSQASQMQKFHQNKTINSIKNRSLASTKQGRKTIKKSGLSHISAPVTLRTSRRQKSKRIKPSDLFHMKRKIFSLLPNDIFVNQKRKEILEQAELDDTNQNDQETYEQRLSKLQCYLFDGHSAFDDLDDLTLDGINVEELLLYPYQLPETLISHSNSQEFHKATELPVARPLKTKKPVKEKTSKPPKNKPPTKCQSCCCICKQIHRNGHQKDAPFIAQMKRESKRLELKAYITQRQINKEKRKLQDIQDDQIIRQTVTVCQGVPHCIRVTHMPKEKPILIVA